jgi:hypothetical protein
VRVGGAPYSVGATARGCGQFPAAALSAAIVFAASLGHLLAPPVLYGVTWDAIASNNSANDVRPIVATVKQELGTGLAAVALLTIAHLLMTSARRRQRDFAILRALGFTSWQVRRTLCWQAVTLAGIALVIGVPAGVACGRLCWQVFAHQLGITPVITVPLTALSIVAAGWLAAAAVIAALPGQTATRNPPAARRGAFPLPRRLS